MKYKKIIKIIQRDYFYYIIGLIIIASLLFMMYITWPYDITIGDIWVINLEKDKERWEHIKEQTSSMKNISITRWNATYGKDITRAQAKRGGVDETITKFDSEDKIVSTTAG